MALTCFTHTYTGARSFKRNDDDDVDDQQLAYYARHLQNENSGFLSRRVCVAWSLSIHCGKMVYDDDGQLANWLAGWRAGWLTG